MQYYSFLKTSWKQIRILGGNEHPSFKDWKELLICLIVLKVNDHTDEPLPVKHIERHLHPEWTAFPEHITIQPSLSYEFHSFIYCILGLINETLIDTLILISQGC